MKAAILVEQNAPLVVADLEPRALEAGQVLVKIEASGICGKQLEEIDGKRGHDPYLPHMLGHEGAGIVAETGPGVRKVKAGDHVVLHWMKGSGIDCAPPTLTWNGSAVNAGCVTTFGEYTVASENRVTPIPKDVPFDVASLLGCAVTTGLGIVFNNAALRPGQSIAVFGVGGVGMNVLQGASLVSAYPVVAIDVVDQKLERAATFGATHTFNGRKPDLESALLELSGPMGFHATVDVTGDAQVRQVAYEVTSNSGTTVLAGVPHHQAQIAIDSFPLHFGRRIIGSHGGDTRPDDDIPRYIELYRLGRLKLDEQITHRFPLIEINEAIAAVRNGDAGRCVITEMKK